jgi:hypothetical protein
MLAKLRQLKLMLSVIEKPIFTFNILEVQNKNEQEIREDQQLKQAKSQ